MLQILGVIFLIIIIYNVLMLVFANTEENTVEEREQEPEPELSTAEKGLWHALASLLFGIQKK